MKYVDFVSFSSGFLEEDFCGEEDFLKRIFLQEDFRKMIFFGRGFS